MTVKELKGKILELDEKIPWSIYKDKQKINWVLKWKSQETDLLKIVMDKSRKRVYFVTDLTKESKSFLDKFRKVNRITFKSIVDWANRKTSDEDYDVYVAFKYEHKDEDLYDYDLAKDNVQYSKIEMMLGKIVLETEHEALSKVKVHGLDESLKELIESYE